MTNIPIDIEVLTSENKDVLKKFKKVVTLASLYFDDLVSLDMSHSHKAILNFKNIQKIEIFIRFMSNKPNRTVSLPEVRQLVSIIKDTSNEGQQIVTLWV